MKRFTSQTCLSKLNIGFFGVAKPNLSIALSLAMLFFSFLCHAQLTGIKTIPGDYPTVAAAVTDLNTQGVGAGGVIFNVAAGHTETIAATISLTATGTMANPVIFQKSGAGANPIITAYTGGTGTPGSAIQDGIWNLVGSDYVTIDGIDLAENPANVANPETMEYGYGLFKASATDGCQDNIIKNCTITLSRVNNASGSGPSVDGSKGINVTNATAAAPTTNLTITAASGASSNNKFYGNTIDNTNIGIALIGYADSSPFAFADTGNDVGGNSAMTGNTIKNFGGGGTVAAAGIRTLAQYGINVSYNSINNNDGAGLNHTSTLRGIYFNTATSASVTCTFNSVTLHGGATTSQVTFIENAAGSTPAGNAVDINNNYLAGDYLTATSGAFYGIYNNSATPTTLNIQDNTISGWSYSNAGLSGSGANYPIYSTGNNAAMTINALNNTVENVSRTGTTGGTTIGIYISSGIGGMSINVNNNIVQNMSIDGTGSSSIMYGIQTPTGTINVNGNIVSTLRCIKTTGTSALYGIYNIASPTDENYNNNEVYTLLHNGTGIVYGIYANTATGTRTVSGNTIYNLSTGGTTIAGMFMALSSPNIFKNKIYDVVSTSTGAPTVSGILLSSTSSSGTANIYNNLIGDLHAPNASTSAVTAPTIRGINITATSTTSNFNVSYNTVYLNAASTGTNFGTTALFATGSATATSGNLTLKNNIFVNTSTAAGTGNTTAYQRSTTSLANYDASSNNNLFYAGTPSATNLIFFDGTNSDQTLADFKTRVAPRETASITENPSFISTDGNNANFLHINTAIATQIESGGISIPGITDDFDGNVRNGTTPDIGGDEFVGVGIDITPPSIVYTPLDDVCATGARMLTATITDASGVPTAGIGLPVLYWSINAAGGPFTAAPATSLGNDEYQFTFGGSAMLGDDVYYYIVAQDNAGTPNVGSSPSAGAGGFTINPPAASTPPTTPNSYEVQSPFTGTFTVGIGGDFTTLTEAANLYNNTPCLTGPVVLELTDANYPSETFPIVFNQNPNASSTNTLTIRPAAANVAIISGSSANAIIRLNGADYITIDGSNSGGTDRSLTIENTNTVTNTAAIWVSSLGAGLGATNNTIKNLNVMAGDVGSTTTLNTFGIHVSGTSITSSATGADNDSLNIQNNSVKKARYGIYARATSVANANDNLTILDNEIGSANPAEYVTFRGIDLTYAEAPVVSRNFIFNMKHTLGASNAAMDFGAGVNNAQITRNRISGIYSESTGGWGAYGINFSSTTSVTNNTIANNFITDIRTVNYSSASTSFNAFGIRLAGGTDTKVYFNSVNLFGDITIVSGSPTQPNSAALLVTTTSVTGLQVKNNIFRNVQTFVSGSPKIYSIWVPASFVFGGIDNNVYHGTSGTGGNPTVYFVGRVGSTDYATLLDWKTFTGQDNSSLFQDPEFMSDLDLHINPAGTPVESGAMPIPGITTDFDGNTRNMTTPDIGADEGTFVLLDIAGPGITFTEIPNSICTNTISLSAQITDASGVNTTAGTKPRLWFKKSTEMNILPATNTSADDGWKYVEASNATSPFTFDIDYSLLTSAVVPGDMIEYFVVAQDLATTPNVGTNTATYNMAPTSVALGVAAFPVSGTKTYSILAAPVTITAVATPDAICLSGDVTLSLTGDPTTGAEYQWQSSPAGAGIWTNIPGATTSNYVVMGVNADTDYRAIISCGGVPIAASPSAVATVDVSNPMVTGTTPGSECGPGPVSVALGATASMGATLNWYDVPTGGTAVGSGTTFNTPPITQTTTYYVAASEGGGSGNVGPVDPSIGTISASNIAIGTQRMYFDILSDVTIVSVDIFPTATIGSNGSITIRDNTQTVIANVPYTTTVTGGNLQTITMNVSLTPGTGYEIGQGTAINLNRNTTGAVYPYTSPAINITGNSFDPVYYYFFYNWQWSSGCESARTAVVATINDLTTYYQDSDGDTYGNPAVTQQACSAPMGYVADNTDCDDTDALEFPGQTWYLDADGDDYSSGSSMVQCLRPANHYAASELMATTGDCDDGNNAVNPGATEVCNGIDDDCDTNIDEGVTTTFYQDSDGDTYGNPAVTQQACSAPMGYVADNTDCDDTDALEFPGQTWYLDADGDDYSSGSSMVQCLRPANHYAASELMATTGDCDDSNAAVNPGATEVCNGIDDDCDTNIDEGVTTTFYQDSDGDTYGNPAVTQQACSAPMGYVANNTDCNDTDALEFPGQTWYLDADGDDYSSGSSMVQCLRPANHYAASELMATTGDCDDSNAAINPGAMEVCNGIDDDCDTNVDEGVTTTYYQDSDGDTYGNPAVTQQACSAPMGYVADNTDCNDTDALEFPGQTWYIDADGDDYGSSSSVACLRPMNGFVLSELSGTGTDDCNDNNAAINPAAVEICNGIDDDCSGSSEALTTTWTGNGNNTTWDDADNWSDDIVPLECQNVVIPMGFNVTVPAGFEGKGLTLEVATGASLTVALTAILSIFP